MCHDWANHRVSAPLSALGEFIFIGVSSPALTPKRLHLPPTSAHITAPQPAGSRATCAVTVLQLSPLQSAFTRRRPTVARGREFRLRPQTAPAAVWIAYCGPNPLQIITGLPWPALTCFDPALARPWPTCASAPLRWPAGSRSGSWAAPPWERRRALASGADHPPAGRTS